MSKINLKELMSLIEGCDSLSAPGSTLYMRLASLIKRECRIKYDVKSWVDILDLLITYFDFMTSNILIIDKGISHITILKCV